MTTFRKVYKYRLRPNKAQEKRLYQLSGARRFIWNWALDRHNTYYVEHGKSISAAQLSSELTALKKQAETAWLKEADSQLLQQALKDVDTARKNFFAKRARFPRFKSKKRDQARFRVPQRVKLEKSKVYIPKIGWIKVFGSQSIEGTTKSATFKQDACGHWFVTLTTEFELPDTPLLPINPDDVVGLDAGLKDFAVLSNETRVKAPKFYRKGQRKLKKVQRQLSRKQKGSRNRKKAQKKVARVHRKIRNQRQDFLHQLSHKLVGQFVGICIEDLNIKGLAKTKLSKSVLDAGHGELRRQLEYKCSWRGKQFAKVDRFFASSKLCGCCGRKNPHLSLADRVWTCVCGTTHDRDLNAAKNIRLEGLKQFNVAVGHTETLNACGASVSHRFGAIRGEARIPRL